MWVRKEIQPRQVRQVRQPNDLKTGLPLRGTRSRVAEERWGVFQCAVGQRRGREEEQWMLRVTGPRRDHGALQGGGHHPEQVA